MPHVDDELSQMACACARSWRYTTQVGKKQVCNRTSCCSQACDHRLTQLPLCRQISCDGSLEGEPLFTEVPDRVSLHQIGNKNISMPQFTQPSDTRQDCKATNRQPLQPNEQGQHDVSVTIRARLGLDVRPPTDNPCFIYMLNRNHATQNARTPAYTVDSHAPEMDNMRAY